MGRSTTLICLLLEHPAGVADLLTQMRKYEKEHDIELDCQYTAHRYSNALYCLLLKHNVVLQICWPRCASMRRSTTLTLTGTCTPS